MILYGSEEYNKQDILNGIEISKNYSFPGTSYRIAPDQVTSKELDFIMAASSSNSIATSEKKVNKYKNGAIYQAKQMGWIGDEYPYLNDKEESETTDNNNSETPTVINENNNTSGVNNADTSLEQQQNLNDKEESETTDNNNSETPTVINENNNNISNINNQPISINFTVRFPNFEHDKQIYSVLKEGQDIHQPGAEGVCVYFDGEPVTLGFGESTQQTFENKKKVNIRLVAPYAYNPSEDSNPNRKYTKDYVIKEFTLNIENIQNSPDYMNNTYYIY